MMPFSDKVVLSGLSYVSCSIQCFKNIDVHEYWIDKYISLKCFMKLIVYFMFLFKNYGLGQMFVGSQPKGKTLEQLQEAGKGTLWL